MSIVLRILFLAILFVTASCKNLPKPQPADSEERVPVQMSVRAEIPGGMLLGLQPVCSTLGTESVPSSDFQLARQLRQTGANTLLLPVHLPEGPQEGGPGWLANPFFQAVENPIIYLDGEGDSDWGKLSGLVAEAYQAGAIYFCLASPRHQPPDSIFPDSHFFQRNQKFAESVRAAGPMAQILIEIPGTDPISFLEALARMGGSLDADAIALQLPAAGSEKGVSLRDLAFVHQALIQLGKPECRLFLISGWGLDKTVERSDLETIRTCLVNGFRRLTTERSDWDPKWLLGALYSPFNDYSVSGGGLVNLHAEPKGERVLNFPPAFPRHRFTIRPLDQHASGGPVVAGEEVRARIWLENESGFPMEQVQIFLDIEETQGAGAPVEARANPVVPIVEPGAPALGEFSFKVHQPSPAMHVRPSAKLQWQGMPYTLETWIPLQVLPALMGRLEQPRLLMRWPYQNVAFNLGLDNQLDSEHIEGGLRLEGEDQIPLFMVGSKEVLLPSRSSFIHDLQLVGEQDIAPGRYDSALTGSFRTLPGQEPVIYRQPIMVDVVAPVFPAPFPIQIDGQPDDWGDRPPIHLTHDPAEPSVTLQSCWDEFGLYFCLRFPRENSTGGGLGTILFSVLDPSNSPGVVGWNAELTGFELRSERETVHIYDWKPGADSAMEEPSGIGFNSAPFKTDEEDLIICEWILPWNQWKTPPAIESVCTLHFLDPKQSHPTWQTLVFQIVGGD